MPPTFVPNVIFGLREQQHAFETSGSNCGPGAIAGTCGVTPIDVLRHMPDFETFRHTREWMLEAALDALCVRWQHESPDVMHYGIARILWGGPWTASENRFDALAHSHWVGIARSHEDGLWVFDINAISKGGWLPMEEWENSLVPFFMKTEEPAWNGTWSFGEGYALSLPLRMDDPNVQSGISLQRMSALDILPVEQPYLHSSPMVCGGRVVIRHTRLSTRAVAGRIADGDGVQHILEDYPDLSREMIEAALSHGLRSLGRSAQ
jgi:uncharacterized protein (DUF433 family)